MSFVDVEQRAEHEPHRVERLHEPFQADVVERGTLLQNGHHLLDTVAARREQFVAHEPLVLGFLLGMVGTFLLIAMAFHTLQDSVWMREWLEQKFLLPATTGAAMLVPLRLK